MKSTKYSNPSKKPVHIPNELQQNLDTWLQNMGLQFNPFDAQFWEAGADPKLPAYLVGHKVFAKLWSDKPSFVFAAPGGGKTAFRVRLARACRIGEDKRRILPVVYKVRSPAEFKTTTPTLVQHLGFLNQAIAQELLLALAYQPDRYLELRPEAQLKIREQLGANLPGELNYYLEQLIYTGDLSPLIEAFDPTAAGLPNPPSPERLRLLCTRLNETPAANKVAINGQTALARFDALVHLARQFLHYEALYFLIDGIDAYPEVIKATQKGMTLLRPLLEQTPVWVDNKIYAKYFLPQEFEDLCKDKVKEALTSIANFVTITWSIDMLIEVLQERLRVASEGKFTSLDAISSPALRDAESEIVGFLKNPLLPREVLVLAWGVLVEHVQRSGSKGKLEPRDLELAYNNFLSSPAPP